MPGLVNFPDRFAYWNDSCNEIMLEVNKRNAASHIIQILTKVQRFISSSSQQKVLNDFRSFGICTWRSIQNFLPHYCLL